VRLFTKVKYTGEYGQAFRLSFYNYSITEPESYHVQLNYTPETYEHQIAKAYWMVRKENDISWHVKLSNVWKQFEETDQSGIFQHKIVELGIFRIVWNFLKRVK